MNAVKERLRAEAAKAAQAAQAAQEAAKEATSKLASSEKIVKLKEQAALAAKAAEEKATASGLGSHLETARSSFSNLSSLLQKGEATPGDASSDDAHAEDTDRLVPTEDIGADHVRDKLRSFGSLSATALQAVAGKAGSTIGQAKSRIDQSVESCKQAGASVAQAGHLAREASAAKLDLARQASANVASKSADGLRTAAAAGSTGMGKLASATTDAKGRCGEALTAASAVSGVSLPGGKRREKQCCELTYRQRLIGCASCWLAGTLLSLFSLGSLAQLLLGNPLPFAFKYTCGNLLSLGAASFLVGPRAQAKGMLAPQRRIASLVYVATLVGTLISALILKRALLSLVFIILQALALCWYLLSYIPYGHAVAKRIGRKLLRRSGLLSEQDAQQHRASVVSPADEV